MVVITVINHVCDLHTQWNIGVGCHVGMEPGREHYLQNERKQS